MITVLVTGATALSLLAAAVVLLTTGRGRTAVRVLLDLLIAAGLLRLATHRGWADLLTAAAVVALRQLLWVSLASGWPGSRRQSPPSCGADDPHIRLAVAGESGENGRASR
ncbi:hypothetical protein ACFOOK_15040 [Micromonospora krabiensis]|uniref:DUF1622 domain-containing protein n=1 Tax=Micromonospora krabiensis TaxID=307121 RepID=A0A1C3N0Z9_9ACTN|nr:hypothetical protein [Micromonospora krabiensis]SBV26246.1 hypothetical protein GA0070620_1732 [Micromonospora krabiensis]